MTIVVMGIILIPLGFMSMEFMHQIPYARDLGVAEGLAKIEMAKINNLAYTDLSLADGTDATTSNYEGYPYDLRRTVNYANSPANTLKRVQVRVYPTGNTATPLNNTITYIADVSFGAGSGGATAQGLEANFLLVSGGSIKNQGGTHELINVTIENTNSSGSITVKGIEVIFIGASGINLQQVRMNAADGTKVRVNGPLASPTGYQAFSPVAVLSAGTSYTSANLLDFGNKDIISVDSLIFTMSDDSTTTVYSWP